MFFPLIKKNIKYIFIFTLSITIIKCAVGISGSFFAPNIANQDEAVKFLTTYTTLIGYLSTILAIFTFSFACLLASGNNIKLKNIIFKPFKLKNIITFMGGILLMIVIIYGSLKATPEVIKYYESSLLYAQESAKEELSTIKIEEIKQEKEKRLSDLEKSSTRIYSSYTVGLFLFLIVGSTTLKRISLNIIEDKENLISFLKRELKFISILKNIGIFILGSGLFYLMFTTFGKINSFLANNVYTLILFETFSLCVSLFLINYLFLKNIKKEKI